MRAIRRFYFYLVSLISLEALLWGSINLARSLFRGSLSLQGSEPLAAGLSLLLVGTPIFLIHWLWAQKAAQTDPEEQSARLRGLFFYTALLATLVPVAQNALALVNRLLLSGAQMPARLALLGAEQTFSDNLIAIAFNLLTAAYFWWLLREQWPRLTEPEAFADSRRLFRYLWLTYTLAMTLFGLQQVLAFLLNLVEVSSLMIDNRSAANGIALLLIGAPLWVYTWRLCQNALEEAAEQFSPLRLGWLYLMAFGGLMALLSAAGSLLYTLFNAAFGHYDTPLAFYLALRPSLNLTLVFGLLWRYYAPWLERESQRPAWSVRRAGLNRLYRYPQAFVGLAASFIGVSFLLALFIDLLFFHTLWGNDLPTRMSAALATLAVGLPLWLFNWLPLQAEALAEGEAAHQARRSLIRRFHLYAILFAAVLGLMTSGGALAYTLLRSALGGFTPSDFWRGIVDELQLLILFAALLAYHLTVLRSDGKKLEQETAPRAAFRALALTKDDIAWATRLESLLKRGESAVALEIWQPGGSLPGAETLPGALILPAGLALQAPENLQAWLQAFPGVRIVLPLEEKSWLWAASLSAQPEKMAAQFLQRLAEGETPHQSGEGLSALQITAYVAAALFGLQLLFVLFSLLMALLGNF